MTEPFHHLNQWITNHADALAKQFHQSGVPPCP